MCPCVHVSSLILLLGAPAHSWTSMMDLDRVLSLVSVLLSFNLHFDNNLEAPKRRAWSDWLVSLSVGSEWS